MNINDLIASWNYASCKVIDIRRITIKAGDSIRSYRVPSSLFLMSIRGNATVHLGQDVYDMQHFTVIHAGKGNVLDIDAGMQDLDYYSIYYKGGVQPLAPSDIASRSFDLSYSITPNNPMPLYRIVSEMEKEWGRSNTLTRLRVGALFYQFVSELLHQLPKQGLNSKKRDLATQIATIVHENYAEAMTLETLSESLNYSVSHLSSYFRLRTGISPIDYLIKVRIDQAAKLLLETDATLKEIAAGVGYHDPSYFSRLFKKHRGVSPIRYREVNAKEQKQVDSPSINVEFSIVSSELVRYADDIDNYYHHEGDGEEDLFMFKDSRTTLVSALLLSFILLLSACGTNDAKETAASQPSPSDAPVSSEQPQTKLVQTINGEIEIPTQPKRIVAGEYLGSLIALGVTPVGTSDHHIKNPYFNQYLKDVGNIGDGNGNVEKILSLKPDLIIMDDFYPELNEQMSKIAPTVVIPYASLKTVHEEISFFGELLGQEERANTWLNEYDKRIAIAKEKVLKVIPADSTFSVIQLDEKEIMAVGADFGKGGQPIYNGFGFKPPADVAAEMADPGWASISAEVLPKYAGDYIILTSDSKKLDELKKDPIWNTLPAIKNDRVFLWTSDRSGYWDPIAILSQTEELAEWLISR